DRPPLACGHRRARPPVPARRAARLSPPANGRVAGLQRAAAARAARLPRRSLGRLFDAPDELGEARVAAQRVEARVVLEEEHAGVAILVGALEGVEGALAVAEAGVDDGDEVGRGVAAGGALAQRGENLLRLGA